MYFIEDQGTSYTAFILQAPTSHYLPFIKKRSGGKYLKCKIFNFDFALGNCESGFCGYFSNTINVYPTAKETA